MLPTLGVSNLIVVALATGVIAAVGWSRVWGRLVDSRIGWGDAWLKGGVITVVAIMLVVYLPSRILQTSVVAGADRPVQDLIGTAVWGLALAGLIAGLAYLQKARRV